VAVSTLTPALKVLSTPLPDMTFFSLVRTKAGPLPGLTCWNSTTLHSCRSMTSTIPFLRSFVVAMGLLGRCRGEAQDSAHRPARPGAGRDSAGGREVDHAQQTHGERVDGAL